MGETDPPDYFREFDGLDRAAHDRLNRAFHEAYEGTGHLSRAAVAVGGGVLGSLWFAVAAAGAFAWVGVVGTVGVALLSVAWAALGHVATSGERVTAETHPTVARLFEAEADRLIPAGMDAELRVVDHGAATALARPVGLRRAQVLVSTGVVETLSEAELRGVLRHEVAHVSSDRLYWQPVVRVGGRALALATGPVLLTGRSLPAAAAGVVGALVVLDAATNLLEHREEVRADRRATGGGRDAAYARALLTVGEVSWVSVAAPLRWLEVLFGSPHPPLVERVERAVRAPSSSASVRVPPAARPTLWERAEVVPTAFGLVGVGASLVGTLSFVGDASAAWLTRGFGLVVAGVAAEGFVAGAREARADGEGVVAALVGGAESAGAVLTLALVVVAVAAVVLGVPLATAAAWAGTVVAALFVVAVLVA